ncbi:MAG: fasciclin domain-containing protein [Anaerolineae bacterium]|nr:fasciclin domain-containing protein [Thermoflexales bacterium]MDW8395698.1 fasciclin domain-containing protein [Anaerolineae bacterium]
MNKRILAASLASALILAACAPVAPAPTPTPVPPTDTPAPTPTPEPTPTPAPTPTPQARDIVDTALAAGSFNTLASAVQAAGLVETLKGEGPFTVFAPNDDAFAKLDKATLDNLLKPENKDQLVAILTYHVVPGKLLAADVIKQTSLKTVQGEEITVKVEGNDVFVNNAKVIATDVQASNGVIHVIDTVILPPSLAQPQEKDIVDTAVAAGTFNTLVQAVQAAGLVETLKGEGPFTVFAPTDEAFAALGKETLDNLLKPENKDTLVAILTYHVVPGKLLAADVVKLTLTNTVQGEPISVQVVEGRVEINSARVLTADVAASNGVIHIIDEVLIPPSLVNKLGQDIVEVATGAGTFSTLLKAVEAAGLVETLKGEGPFTVFAPTDEAFAALGKETLDNLLKPENKEQLAAILSYHVVPRQLVAGEVIQLAAITDTAAATIKTVQGELLLFSSKDGEVFVSGAKVITTDIRARNGMIHVIDKVILPPSVAGDKDVVDTAIGVGSFTTLVRAVKAAELVETLKGKGPFTVFAPNDEAFAKLDKATLDNLLKPENKQQLANILTFHVVPSKLLAADVVKQTKIKTVQGQEVTVEVKGNDVFINGAKVLKTDVLATNGVIHVIDTVIQPK